MEIKGVVVVNHGNVFNTGNWYTFYCPHCKSQVDKVDSKIKCKSCKEKIKW